MAGVIGLRGPDIDKRGALRGYKVEWRDADRPIIRPHTGAPVLNLAGGAPAVDRHVFGFSRKFSSFNARDDKLEEGRMWKPLFGKPGHHGVAPVSYILEWGDLGDGLGHRPWRIERADGAAMAVPALVGAYWDAPETRAFALVTIEPNRFVGQFHDRMIAQLRDEQVEMWLHPETTGREGLRECLGQPPDDELVAFPLKGDVGAAKFSDAAALEAVGPALRWGATDGRDNRARRPVEAQGERPQAKAAGSVGSGRPRQARLGES